MPAGARQANRLVITIRPQPSDDGRLQVREAFQQVLGTLELFEQAQRSLGDPHASFVWRLEKASTESPFTIIAVADPVDLAVDVTPQVARVKATVANGIRALIDRGEPPAWLERDTVTVVRDIFARNLDGIARTEIDFEAPSINPLAIDRAQATAGLRAVEAINPMDAAGIPERTAYGEIEGQMLAAGRYNRRPAVQIYTHLYGFVWCVLNEALVSEFGSQHRLAEVWEGKAVGVDGRLHYLRGGRLNRIEAERMRPIEAPAFDINAILDPDFTAGFDPVEYLERLHEGDLA
jgi:hypothetical protein